MQELTDEEIIKIAEEFGLCTMAEVINLDGDEPKFEPIWFDGCHLAFARALLARAREKYGPPESKKCEHRNGTTPAYDFCVCNDCGAVHTDNGWGVASRRWFKNTDEAKFFKKNGRLPT